MILFHSQQLLKTVQADAAYEWELGLARTNLDKETKAVSDGLAKAFATYINSLNNFLSDTSWPYNANKQKEALGQNMMIPEGWIPRGPQGLPPEGPAGKGNHRPSAEDLDGVNREKDAASGNVDLSGTYTSASDYIAALNANEEWVIYDEKTNTAKITSVEAFMKNVKQLQKSVGAFDDMKGGQSENTLFGLGDGKGLHFDAIMAQVLEENGSPLAEEYKADLAKKDSLGSTMEERSNMYNPMYYLSSAYKGYKTSKVANFW